MTDDEPAPKPQEKETPPEGAEAADGQPVEGTPVADAALAFELLLAQKERGPRRVPRRLITGTSIFILIALAMMTIIIVWTMDSKASGQLIRQLERDRAKIGAAISDEVATEQRQRLLDLWKEMEQRVMRGRADMLQVADARLLLSDLVEEDGVLDPAEVDRLIDELEGGRRLGTSDQSRPDRQECRRRRPQLPVEVRLSAAW